MRSSTVAAVYGAVEKIRNVDGRRNPGMVFRQVRKENHPVCAQLRWLRGILLMGAATPPCCDARRGLRQSSTFRHFFPRRSKRGRRSQTAATVFLFLICQTAFAASNVADAVMQKDAASL